MVQKLFARKTDSVLPTLGGQAALNIAMELRNPAFKAGKCSPIGDCTDN
ncbi:MAG: hypothetical protein ACLSD6_10195 [Clostridium sp.]